MARTNESITSEDFPSKTPSFAATNFSNLDNCSKFVLLLLIVSFVSFRLVSCLDSPVIESNAAEVEEEEEVDMPFNMQRSTISLAYLELNPFI
jgi:hypothetical protein